MLLRRSPPLVLAGALACSSAACKKRSEVVVGIVAQPALVGQMGKLHVEATVGAKVVEARDFVPKPAQDKLAAPESVFPIELHLESEIGAHGEVTIEAFRAGPNGAVADHPMLVRRASFPFVPGGESALVRLQLESSCITGVPGFKGPACPATQSCARGRCIDPTLLADDLEPYQPSWATVKSDRCWRRDGGAPVVEVGTGRTEYLPLVDGQTLAPERGPQGGHHLWMAVRMKNLRQSGTTVTLTAEQEGTGLRVPPTSFVFEFEPVREGFCALYGLRLQIDNSSVPVARFLGKALDLHVALRDQNGTTAEASAKVRVAETTIGD
jgi:hypothetical protein